MSIEAIWEWLAEHKFLSMTLDKGYVVKGGIDSWYEALRNATEKRMQCVEAGIQRYNEIEQEYKARHQTAQELMKQCSKLLLDIEYDGWIVKSEETVTELRTRIDALLSEI